MLNEILKFLNVLALFVFLVMFMALKARAEEPVKQTYHHCQIKTGDVGDFRYRGETIYEAILKTSDACLQARLKLHKKVKGVEADEDRVILYMEKCVNENVCWER